MSVGWHVPRKDFSKYLSGPETLKCAQVFLRSPRQGFSDPKMSEEDLEILSKYGKDLHLYVHAPYTIVPFKDKSKIKQYGKALSKDIAFALIVKNVRGIVLHEGNKKDNIDSAIIAAETFAAAYEYAGVSKGMHDVPKILVENSTKGRSALEFAELVSDIRKHLKKNPETNYLASKIGICYDTQHAYARGPEPITVSTIIEEIEEIKNIAGTIDLIHFNDSATACGSTVDRHGTPGDGPLFDEKGLHEFLKYIKSSKKDAVIERPEVDYELLVHMNA